MSNFSAIPIERIQAQAFRIPTEQPESDGTLEWDATTLVVVQVSAGSKQGLGYTYADAAVVPLIHEKLASATTGEDAMDTGRCWKKMADTIRNLGQTGLAMMGVAAVDNALWDLKARLLGVPLVKLLGQVRAAVPIYGSGGFTSYSESRLAEQLSQWAGQGMAWVKMKVGRDPAADVHRVRQARAALETTVGLFVDANGAYERKQALRMARYFVDYGVSWFEEPVYHRDFEGTRFLQQHAPAGMEIAGGEYGFNLNYYQRLITANGLDVVQADATRCGITGFLQVATLCDSHNLPLSSHTAPALHLHLAAAVERVRHLEYFHDHVRIERMLFEGLPEPVEGRLRPALDREGMGLEFRQADARRYAMSA